MNGRVVASGVLMALAAGCVSSGPSKPPARVSSPPVSAGLANCPVTVPKNGPSSVPKEALFGWESAYGDERLVVGGLGTGGVIRAAPDFIEKDGSIGMKFGWWRGVPGELRITGHRLDGTAAPLRASVPTGYGDRGFQSSGVYFSTEGCWEVTGAVGKIRLTFVTYVIKP